MRIITTIAVALVVLTVTALSSGCKKEEVKPSYQANICAKDSLKFSSKDGSSTLKLWAKLICATNLDPDTLDVSWKYDGVDTLEISTFADCTDPHSSFGGLMNIWFDSSETLAPTSYHQKVPLTRGDFYQLRVFGQIRAKMWQNSNFVEDSILNVR